MRSLDIGAASGGRGTRRPRRECNRGHGAFISGVLPCTKGPVMRAVEPRHKAVWPTPDSSWR